MFQGNKCEVDVRNPGTQCGFRIVMEEYLPLSTSGRLYDATAESPFFNYKVGRLFLETRISDLIDKYCLCYMLPTFFYMQGMFFSSDLEYFHFFSKNPTLKHRYLNRATNDISVGFNCSGGSRIFQTGAQPPRVEAPTQYFWPIFLKNCKKKRKKLDRGVFGVPWIRH